MSVFFFQLAPAPTQWSQNVARGLILTEMTSSSALLSDRGATSYRLRPVLTYCNGYWEVYRRFQGHFLVGEVLKIKGLKNSIEEFFTGEENFHEGRAGFYSII